MISDVGNINNCRIQMMGVCGEGGSEGEGGEGNGRSLYDSVDPLVYSKTPIQNYCMKLIQTVGTFSIVQHSSCNSQVS